MNIKVTLFLILSSIVLLNKGMQEGKFEQRCDAAHSRYQGQEQVEVEKERNAHEDIEGYIKHTLSDKGFLLREKDQKIEFLLNYFNEIIVYCKQDSPSYIDLHLNGFKKWHLVRDIVESGMQPSRNLSDLWGNICDIERFKGCYSKLMSTILSNCIIKKDDQGRCYFSTDNLLQGTNLIIDSGNRNLEQSLLSKMGYTALGFVIALPCYYVWYLKFGKNKY